MYVYFKKLCEFRFLWTIIGALILFISKNTLLTVYIYFNIFIDIVYIA